MAIKRAAALLAVAIAVQAPRAHAGPFHVDPTTGVIVANSNSLTFTYVSRSASYTHWFGLFTMAHTLLPPDYIFNSQSDSPGTKETVAVTPGTSYVFGLYVLQNGMLWFSDRTSSPSLPYQRVKFTFTDLDDYTTRIRMEELKNLTVLPWVCYGTTSEGSTLEYCDYDDMIVDVTNNPEPATMTLLALGLAGVGGARYRLKRRRKGADMT